MNTRHRSQQGIALVIVLAFLVLLTGIVLAFFIGITSEQRFAKTTADAANTQQIANSAVNMVMAQIVDATSGNAGDSMLSWASQPGMIRTFDSSGSPANCFKLYSSDRMVSAGNGFSIDADLPPADWNSTSNAGIYADLNAPVLVPDPAGLIKPEAGKPETYSAVFPIMNPFAEGVVDGFSLSSRPGFTDPGTGQVTLPTAPSYDPTQATANKTANPAPMPVRWLYVLRDGKVVSPTGGGNGKLTIPGVTKANPVTGRMAFWTDDETSKVNINTASEGVFWDIPRVYSSEDFGRLGTDAWASVVNNFSPGLSICQPVQKEYQRYPGHPATTSLSPIFGNLGLSIPNPVTSANASQFAPYYAIAPKIALGGSNAGTKLLTPPGISGFTPLTPDTDRLYASVDELMFTPKFSGVSRITNPTASDPSPTPTVLTKSVLEKTRFFLTAGSNAPEVTLFNTPRISIWPVWDPSANKNLTAYDKLARFCGTIGDQSYYFTRRNARSDHDDYDLIPRNQILYQYLQTLTGKNIPGYGGNFVSKYTQSERDQILTLIFDYIRCINLADSQQSTPPDSKKDAVPYAPIFSVTLPPSDPRLDPTAPAWMGNDVPDLFPLGAGEVVPIKIGSTMGAGRILTVTEADLMFYATHKTGANTDKIQAVLLLQFASPMQGMAGMRSSLKYTITGLDQFQIQPVLASGAAPWQSLELPKQGTNFIEISDFQTAQGRGIGGVEGPAEGIYALGGHNFGEGGYGTSVKGLFASGGAAKGNYPFFSGTDVPIAQPAKAPFITAFNFRGDPSNPSPGVITISLSTQQMPGDSTPEVVVQTIALKIPDGTFKLPTIPTTSAYNFTTARLTNNGALPVLGGSGNGGGTGTGITSFLVTANDTVVGVQPAGSNGNDPGPAADATAGDYRLIAPLANVPTTRFRAHNSYVNTTTPTQFAHGLMTAGARGSSLYFGATMGKLAPVVQYVTGGAGWGNSPNPPYTPSRVVNGVTRKDGGPGDWDSGIGNTPDGAYMNKPDEGDTQLICHPVDKTITRYPYLFGGVFSSAPPGTPYFSPNRQVPSPLMFGSIPTGVQRGQPWQTLLFHPRPEDTTHPGKTSPKDHLIADLFWVPVVEPYAISQPFATAGKINLNYQILPFTYIKRQTGLNAVMKATQFLAIPPGDSGTYKPSARDHGSQQKTDALSLNTNRRHRIDVSTTLKACETKFANSEIYRSATEICELDLYPSDETVTSMASYWNNNKLTGDNLREKPYVDLYPRLTTKSNTYTVHVCVQAVQQIPAHAADGVFVDPNSSEAGAKDSVLGEYRGSTTLERYIDPNDPALPDFAKLIVQDPSNSALNIDQYYKFRVLGTKRFAP